MAGLTIGKFAAEAGVSVETVRFYQRRGLLALPERRGSGFREYSEADQWRLAFIRRARQLGFTLAEIRDLLGPVPSQSSAAQSTAARSTGDITRAAEAKLDAIAAQIAELAALACRLRRLVQVCAHGSRDDCVALHLGDPQADLRLASREESARVCAQAAS
jgi:MerR family copper efflux transcriptional regulator